MWAISAIFKKLPKVKNRPRWRKFAQSGHPDYYHMPVAEAAEAVVRGLEGRRWVPDNNFFLVSLYQYVSVRRGKRTKG
jgi:hypothetical protein